MCVTIQRFRANRGLLGSEAGKGRPLDLGRMSAIGSKTVYMTFLKKGEAGLKSFFTTSC